MSGSKKASLSFQLCVSRVKGHQRAHDAPGSNGMSSAGDPHYSHYYCYQVHTCIIVLFPGIRSRGSHTRNGTLRPTSRSSSRGRGAQDTSRSKPDQVSKTSGSVHRKLAPATTESARMVTASLRGPGFKSSQLFLRMFKRFMSSLYVFMSNSGLILNSG